MCVCVCVRLTLSKRTRARSLIGSQCVQYAGWLVNLSAFTREQCTNGKMKRHNGFVQQRRVCIGARTYAHANDSHELRVISARARAPTRAGIGPGFLCVSKFYVCVCVCAATARHSVRERERPRLIGSSRVHCAMIERFVGRRARKG